MILQIVDKLETSLRLALVTLPVQTDLRCESCVRPRTLNRNRQALRLRLGR